MGEMAFDFDQFIILSYYLIFWKIGFYDCRKMGFDFD